MCNPLSATVLRHERLGRDIHFDPLAACSCELRDDKLSKGAVPTREARQGLLHCLQTGEGQGSAASVGRLALYIEAPHPLSIAGCS